MKTAYFIFALLFMVDFVVFMQRLAYWIVTVLDGKYRLERLPYGIKYDRVLKLYNRAKIHLVCWVVINFVTFCFYCDCVSQVAKR